MEKTYLIDDILNAMDQINSKNINFTIKKKPIVKKKKNGNLASKFISIKDLEI